MAKGHANKVKQPMTHNGRVRGWVGSIDLAGNKEGVKTKIYGAALYLLYMSDSNSK